MVDKIQKAINRLTPKERKAVKSVLYKIKNAKQEGLDIKKLKGRTDIYRVRIGKNRIIFRMDGDKIKILTIERRSDNTYNL